MKSYALVEADQSFNEEDARYLEEVILKVKEECETATPTSEFIEVVLKEFGIETNDEWEALIAEAREQHKTLKRITDISCMSTIINILQVF